MTPTGVLFEQIYSNNNWGGEKGEFYSGAGSGEPYASEYARVVRDLINKYKISRVVDIGCGDFRIGSLIVDSQLQYIGVDTVKPLVERNQKLFGAPNTTFVCLDAVKEKLPDGELGLIRQVLQHLSNAEIHRILKKAKEKYRYLLITEHHPPANSNAVPNKDMVHGSSFRRKVCQSGVYPHLPPFSIGEAEILLEMEWPARAVETKDGVVREHRPAADKDTLVTMLFRFDA